MTNTKNVKKGDKIRVLCMSGEPSYNGKIGVVELIDDAGQLHGTWGGCAIIPTVDEFEIIEKEEKYLAVLKNFRGLLFWKILPFTTENSFTTIKEELNCTPVNASKIFPDLKDMNIETYISSDYKKQKYLTFLVEGSNIKQKQIKGNVCFVKKEKKTLLGLSSEDLIKVIRVVNAPTKIINTINCNNLEITEG